MPINCPLVLRTIKNSKLTFNELDGNFLNLRECIHQLENQISTQDTYVTGGTYSSGTTTLDFVGNVGFTPFSVDVSALTGGTGGGTIITGNYLPLSGGTMTGDIDLETNKLVFNSAPLDSFIRWNDSITDAIEINNVNFDGVWIGDATTSPRYGSEFDGGTIRIWGAGPFMGILALRNELSGSSVEFRGDIISEGNFVTLQSPNQSGTIALTTDLSSVTGFTYSNNNFTISQSGGLSDLVSNISVMTGLTVNGQTTMSGDGQNLLTIVGSGNTEPLLTVQGSSGELFTITDDLEGLLFSVNDISGLPILEVYDDDTVHMGNFQAPALNTTVKLNPGTGLSTVYSLPISAYTGAFFDYTVSNTTGVRAGNISSIWSGSTVEFNEVPTNDIGSTTPITFTMSSDGSNASLQVSATTTGWEVKTIVRSI